MSTIIEEISKEQLKNALEIFVKEYQAEPEKFDDVKQLKSTDPAEYAEAVANKIFEIINT